LFFKEWVFKFHSNENFEMDVTKIPILAKPARMGHPKTFPHICNLQPATCETYHFAEISSLSAPSSIGSNGLNVVVTWYGICVACWMASASSVTCKQ
jgi:hypothetical protein